MSITKILGHFIVEEIEKTGYISEKGEVFIDFNGVSLNVEDFNRRIPQAIGFTATKEKVARYNEFYSEIAESYGFKKKVAEEPPKEEVEAAVEEPAEQVTKEVTEEATKEPEKPRRRRNVKVSKTK